LEWLISTPAFHHWHHTKDGPEYINKNYAAIFPWVDKLFGSFYLPKDQWPAKYGVDLPMAPGLIGQLLQPFASREIARMVSGEGPSVASQAGTTSVSVSSGSNGCR